MTSLEKRTVRELLTRHLLLFGMVLAGSLSFMVVFPFFWFLIYASTSLMTLVLLGRLNQHRSYPNYIAALAVFGIRLATFRIMIVYLWLHPEPVAQFIALFMFMAAWRFSINQKSRIRSYALLTAFGDLTTLTVLSGFAFLDQPFSADNMLIGAATASLGIYYVVTLQQAHRGLLEIEALEEQSRQSQKMEAIGRLTGGVAHDFNNILTVVIGNLELHDEISDQGEQADLVRRARTAAERASLLTAQLLAFSRQSPMSLEPVETTSFLSSLNELTERVLPASVQLHLDVAPDIWAMYVDRIQLEVALLNLIINARDAMPNGGALTLSAVNHLERKDAKTAPTDRYVWLELLDDGQGIPPEIISKVTDPFFTTKAVGEGSGLGLSMVKGFAEQSGGDLRITSKPGVGTKVSLLIPAAAESGSAPEA